MYFVFDEKDKMQSSFQVCFHMEVKALNECCIWRLDMKILMYGIVFKKDVSF